LSAAPNVNASPASQFPVSIQSKCNDDKQSERRSFVKSNEEKEIGKERRCVVPFIIQRASGAVCKIRPDKLSSTVRVLPGKKYILLTLCLLDLS
jgi:hypothetical protein